MGSSGGGQSQPQSQTVYNSSLPEYAEPYYKDLMKRTQEISKEEYQPYTGQRIAGQGGDTEQGLEGMRDYAYSGSIYGDLMGDSQHFTDQSMGVGGEFANYNMGPGYDATDFSGYGSFYDGRQIGVDGQDITGDFDSAAASKYMSPYMDEVVARSKEGMWDDYQRAQTQQNADLGASGAFGGSRAAVMNMMGQRDYLDRSLDYEATARQSAFENAQSQFERDRAARMGLASQNQEMGMWEQSQDDMVKQFAAQHGLNEEQVRQAALTGQLSALDMAGTMTDRTSQLQGLYDKASIDRANALLGVGQTEESYQQDALDLAYQDFVNQRDYEKGQIQFYAGALKGVPVTANSDVMTYQRSNPALGILGGIGALGSMGGLQGAV